MSKIKYGKRDTPVQTKPHFVFLDSRGLASMEYHCTVARYFAIQKYDMCIIWGVAMRCGTKSFINVIARGRNIQPQFCFLELYFCILHWGLQNKEKTALKRMPKMCKTDKHKL